LKDFLQDAYNNWEIPPQFVTLIGDVDGDIAIPAFNYALAGHGGAADDHEYSLLEGDDYFPDIYIGRLSVTSTDELETVVNRIINYETNPYLSGQRYFDRGLLASDTSALMSMSVMLWAGGLMESYGYTDVESIYYFSYMPVTAVTASLNTGIGMFNFRGWHDWGGFDQEAVHGLNNINMTPVIFGCASETNNLYETESMGEAWLRAGSADEPAGAIGCIGPSAYDTYAKYDGTLDQGMTDALYNKDLFRLGEILNSGKFELWLNFPLNRGSGNPLISVECYYHAYNVLGDPAAPVWTLTPYPVTSEHSSTVPLGRNYLDVVASDRYGLLPDAFVTLLKEGEIFSSGYTDESGEITLPLQNASAGDMTITITHPNRKPYQSTISLFDARAYLGFNSFTIDDDSTGGSLGNGDGVFNPGERIELTLALENFGGTGLSDVTGTIDCSNPSISVMEGTRDYGYIAGGDTVTNSESFIIQSSLDSQDGMEVAINITAMDSTAHSFTSGFDIEFAAPFVEIINVNYPSLLPDTTLSPNQESDMVLSLTNTGGSLWSELTCIVSCETEGITISDTVGVFPQCNPGETVDNSSDPFYISVDQLVFMGLEVPLYLTFENSNGWTQGINYSINIDNPTIFDPVLPMDGYGYYCFSDDDVGYGNTPIYNWREINPHLGGEGTLIELTDPIPNRGDSEIIDLPTEFNFVHYGQAHDQLTVCSNGWIAAGITSYWEFRNKALPSAGIPGGLIAPFWDDLIIESDAGVYYYYDDEDDAFIIEWSSLQNAMDNALETFQVILWDADAYTTPTDDSPISFNYQSIDNVDNLNNYATVGILNNEADAGLQYSFAGIYTPGANPLVPNRALYFTTEPGSRVGPPSLEYSPTSFELAGTTGEIILDSLEISNMGEANLEFQTRTGYWSTDASGGPDAFGYVWVDSDDPEGFPYNWIDITDIGTEINFPQNDSTSADLPFGFDFKFYGNTFNSIILSANGWCSFTSHASSYYNTQLPSIGAPPNLVAALWDDLDPLAGNCEVYIWSNETDSVVVSYINVEKWGSIFGQYTYQVILEANGRIAFQYQRIQGNNTSSTVGIQNQARDIGLTISYNQAYLHDNLRIDIQKPWLSMNPSSGAIPGGGMQYVLVQADARTLPPDEYSSEIILTSNDPQHIYQTIPVSLTVTGTYVYVDGLQITLNENGVDLRWQSEPSAIGYRIYRSSFLFDSIQDYEFIGQTSETYFTDGAKMSEVPCFYRVMIIKN